MPERPAIHHISIALKHLNEERAGLDRTDRRGRFLALAITDLESAENWLARSEEIRSAEFETECEEKNLCGVCGKPLPEGHPFKLHENGCPE